MVNIFYFADFIFICLTKLKNLSKNYLKFKKNKYLNIWYIN